MPAHRLPPASRVTLLSGALLGAAAARGAARTLHAKRVADGLRDRVRDHRATVGAGIGAPLTLVVLGDSAADGFGIVDPAQAFPAQVARRLATATGRRVDVHSLAVNGHRTSTVLAEQVPLLRTMPAPDVIVVNVGVNDAMGRLRATTVEHDTRRLLDTLEQLAPEADVCLVTCPDISLAPGLKWPVSTGLSVLCRRVAKGQLTAVRDRPDLAVVAYTRRPGPEVFGEDGFHPGIAGQAVLAEMAVQSLLAKHDGLAREPEDVLAT